MAILFQEQHDLAVDMNFANRVRQAALTVALEVLAATDANYARYSARAALASRVLNDPAGQSKRLAYALATASPAANHAAIADAALLTFVRNNWTVLSGFNPNAPEPPA